MIHLPLSWRHGASTLLVAWLLSTPAVLAEADSGDTESKLDTLKTSIGKLQSWLTSAKDTRTGILGDLRKSELEIARIAKNISGVTRDIERARARMVTLQRQRGELLAAKQRQAGYLAQQIRAAYSIGRQEYIKVLLNQEHPDQVARAMKYYDYFNRARTEQIEAYTTTISELQQTEQAIGDERAALQQARGKLEDKRAALSNSKQRRRQVLLKLERNISSKDKELGKLLADREHLEELLRAVEQSLADIELPDAAIPIQQLRGRLPWPAAGKLTRRFGSRDTQTGNRWNGVLISATEGQDVLAIHHGRVIFADWLRGFGLLIILDHGNGYMSLYGHNQVLFKDVGEWVGPAEVIAGIGNSGGQAQTGLYFEIRHNGKPQDPQKWVAAGKPRKG